MNCLLDGEAYDANGWVSDRGLVRDFEHFRRVRDENWFALIGAIDRDRHTEFVMGVSCEFVASKDGELTCYANDAPFMYWNNHGSIELTVERIA